MPRWLQLMAIEVADVSLKQTQNYWSVLKQIVVCDVLKSPKCKRIKVFVKSFRGESITYRIILFEYK